VKPLMRRMLVVASLAFLPPFILTGARVALGANAAGAASPTGCTGTTTVTCTFGYTGAAQIWTVPAGMTHATFTLYGAEGGVFGIVGDNDSGGGGLGAKVTASLVVTPNTTLQVNVGQAGALDGGVSFGGGGPVGAYSGGGSGGGASDIRNAAADGSYPLADRLLVAGGGGGTGYQGACSCSAPDRSVGAGGNAGSPGTSGGSWPPPWNLGGGGGGGAGTTSAPGTGGAGGQLLGADTCSGADKGDPGSPGGTGQSQGTGGAPGAFQLPGGGGGGGYFGGGGGGGGAGDDCQNYGSAGGGGGGASYSSVAGATITDAVAPDAPNGEAIITYTAATSGVGSSGPGANKPLVQQCRQNEGAAFCKTGQCVRQRRSSVAIGGPQRGAGGGALLGTPPFRKPPPPVQNPSTLNEVPADWQLIQVVSSGDVDWAVFKISDESAN
jgi:hypothetical protein